MARDTDLDVNIPEKVPDVLRAAADIYYESANDLSSAWQDEAAGEVWGEIARILESAADKIDKVI